MRRPSPPPAPSNGCLREIVHSRRFEKDRDSIDGNIERMDEALRGLEWVVARSPEAGQSTDAPGIYGHPLDLSNSRSAVVYYSFDTGRVVLESMVAFDAAEG
jgi:hypothetical protein